MKYIAIAKTAKHHKPRKGLPEHFPIECHEYDSEEAARLAHPDAQIMSVEAYKAYAQELHEKHPAPPSKLGAKKPWWKFW